MAETIPYIGSFYAGKKGGPIEQYALTNLQMFDYPPTGYGNLTGSALSVKKAVDPGISFWRTDLGADLKRSLLVIDSNGALHYASITDAGTYILQLMTINRSGGMAITGLGVSSGSAPPSSAPYVNVGCGNAQYPRNLHLEPSTHATSRRCALSLGEGPWQIGTDINANGGKDLYVYDGNNSQTRLGIATDGQIATKIWTDYSSSATWTGQNDWTSGWRSIQYMKIGKLVFITIDVLGNSTSTSYRMSLPYEASSGCWVSMGSGTDNGASLTTASTLAVHTGIISTSICFGLNGGYLDGGWTNVAGNAKKGIRGILWYIATSATP
jgi:hypothetical protein